MTWNKSSLAAGTPVLRRLNTAVVLEAVRQVSPTPVRIAELAKLTSLARPTVAQAVEDLLESGWLTQHAPQEDRLPGRPATRFSLNGLAAPVLGIDVGAHSVTVAVADLTGKQLALVRRHTVNSETGQSKGATQLLVRIDAAVAEALASTDLLPGQVAAVAVGSPGLIDPERGSARIAPSMPDWPEIRIDDHLAKTFDCPVLSRTTPTSPLSPSPKPCRPLPRPCSQSSGVSASDQASSWMVACTAALWLPQERSGSSRPVDGRNHSRPADGVRWSR